MPKAAKKGKVDAVTIRLTRPESKSVDRLAKKMNRNRTDACRVAILDRAEREAGK